MRNLDARNRSLFRNEVEDLFQRSYMSIAPDAQVARADARLRQDRRRFRHDHSRAANGAAAQVYKVPIRGEPVVTGILAHR